MKTRILLSILLIAAMMSTHRVVHLVFFPVRAMDVGVRQLEDDVAPFAEVQTFAMSRTLVLGFIVCVFIAVLALIWRKAIKQSIERTQDEPSNDVAGSERDT